MAGWSILTNGFGLGSGESLGVRQGNGVTVDAVAENGSDSEGLNVKVRRLFDKILSVFLKAIGEKGAFRPVPVVVDYREPVDLFKLFWVVREKGGYDYVSKKRLWSLVAKESGLSVGATAAVKLVYLKYLRELEQWLREKRFKDQTSGNGNFRLLSWELESEFRDLFSDRFYLGEKKNGGLVRVCSHNSHQNGGGGGGSNKDNEDGVIVFNSSFSKKEKDCKRKRESLSGLLKWLTEIASRSDDPSVGIIAGTSKLKEHEDKEFWVQAMRAREVLLHRRPVDSNNEESLLQVEFLYVSFCVSCYCSVFTVRLWPTAEFHMMAR